MTSTEPRKPHPLIGHLLSLVDQDDRGALARLRRGLGKTPGTDIGSFPDIIPYIPTREDGPAFSWPYFVVAALFATYPHQGKTDTSIGAAMRQLKESPSRDGRFRALLNAHHEDLPTHLRHVVSQLKAGSVMFDWGQVLNDLRGWTHEDQYIQRRWARDFYSDR